MEQLILEISCLTIWLEWDYNVHTIAIMLPLMMELEKSLQDVKSPQMREKIENWMDAKITLWERLVHKNFTTCI